MSLDNACLAWQGVSPYQNAEVGFYVHKLVLALQRQLQSDAQRLHMNQTCALLYDPGCCEARQAIFTSKLLTLTLMTDREPTREQIARYTKMLLLPWMGATETIKYRITAVAVKQYSKKPASTQRGLS